MASNSALLSDEAPFNIIFSLGRSSSAHSLIGVWGLLIFSIGSFCLSAAAAYIFARRNLKV
jgi:hypothetical protein